MKLKLSYSISIYCILLFTLIFICYNLDAFREHASGVVLYLFLLPVILYVFFSRYSCRLSIDEHQMLHIHYLAPWMADVYIDLKDYAYFDYGRGFYGSMTDRDNGFKGFLRYPYDTVVFGQNAIFSDKTETIRINLRFRQFGKFMAYMKEIAGLKFANSKGIDRFF